MMPTLATVIALSALSPLQDTHNSRERSSKANAAWLNLSASDQQVPVPDRPLLYTRALNC